MKFFRNLLAAILGFFIALFLLFFIFGAIAASVGKTEEIVVKSNSVLELDLSSNVKDYAPASNDPIEKILELEDEKLALNKIINALENAKSDDKIKGVSIKTSKVSAGLSQVQAIRNKIKEFKETGKFVYAYNDVYTQKNYYLSSIADSLFLNPIGGLEFNGLSAEVLFYKDFEDKYGLKMEVVRHGKFKSAVEPFLANKMSDANREQTSSFLGSMWSEMTRDISESRNIPVQELNTIVDNSYSRNSVLAKKHRLIDESVYEDQYQKKLEEVCDVDKVNTISIADYIASGKGKIRSITKDKIAVIYAQGEIIYGKGDENYIGQGIINKAIKKAVKNKKVKAIVLRVNSPGGSALASELIWRELTLAKKKKPLVVSMGNYAASGGYYIASPADKIVAEPTTITGSIGVFGILPNAHQFAKNIGVNAEQVTTNNSPSYSVFEPVSKRFYDVTQEGVERIYKTFVNRVSEGRKMSFDEVDKIAQGRVWTGKQALKIGLVDKLGSLDDAVALAAELAETTDYSVRNYPNYKKDFKDALKMNPFLKVDKQEIIKEALGDETFRLYQNMHQMQKMKGIQARMPYVLEVK